MIAGEEAFVDGVPWELLHARTAGLDVFACHLAPAPTHGLHRRRQVVAIDELIRAARGDLDVLLGGRHHRAAMPPILCGDFNAEPDSDEIRFLCGLTPLDGRTTFFQDAWRVAGDGPGLTQDWRGNPIAAAMNVHRKRIDYVFVGDPFQRAGGIGRVLRAEPAFHEPLTGVLASDHAGLVVDIAWPTRPVLIRTRVFPAARGFRAGRVERETLGGLRSSDQCWPTRSWPKLWWASSSTSVKPAAW